MCEQEHATHGRDAGCHHIEADLGFLASDHPAAAAFRSFMRALHLHRRLIVQALGDVDAHPAQAICLRRLSAEDGLAQRELADEMFLTPPTVSRMVKTMEQSGVIERRPDPDDQRVTRVYLTAKGRRLADDLKEVTSRYVAETFGSLPDQDLRQLAGLLDRLSAGLQEAADQREAGDGPAGGDPAHSEEEVAP